MKYDRRQFVQGLSLVSAALAVPRLFAQTAATTTKLTDKISVIGGAGNNMVALSANGSTLLVDSGNGEGSALAGLGKIATVFNTHWHPESTGGNDAVAKAGAKIVSHIHTQLWMTQEINHDWEKKVYPPRAKAALPTETFYKDGKLDFAGEPVEYALLPLAHTDGDLYVYFPQSNVLAVGDAVQFGRMPDLDWFTGGWMTGMVNAHRTIIGIANDQTKIVPASGPVLTKAQVQTNMETMTRLRDHLVTLIKQGNGPQDLIDAKAMKDFPDLQGNPETFLYVAYRGLWLHARELGGVV